MARDHQDVDGQMSFLDMMQTANGTGNSENVSAHINEIGTEKTKAQKSRRQTEQENKAKTKNKTARDEISEKKTGYHMAGPDEILNAMDQMMEKSGTDNSASDTSLNNTSSAEAQDKAEVPDNIDAQASKMKIPKPSEVPQIYEEDDLVSPVYDRSREFVVIAQKGRTVIAQDPKTKDTHEMALSDLVRVRHFGLIFDMDGTLWDASENVARSWTEVLSRHPEMPRQSVSREEIKSVMGQTMTYIQKTFGMSNAIMKECMTYENQYLEEHGAVLPPDLEQSLKKLSEMVPLYICSNCQKGYIEAFLKWSGFGKYFKDKLCFGDNNKGKDKNIRILAKRNGLTDYYYVGDIENDYQATVAAGGTFIHAAYGFGEVPEAEYRIEKFSDLPGLMQKILDEMEKK